jgi:tripeptide aminopeptidase
MAPEVAINDLLDLLAISGSPGKEGAVADHLRRVLTDLGVRPEQIVSDDAHRHSEYGGDCGNLIVRLDGRRPGPRRMFSAHMDTVPGAVGARPRLEIDRIVNDAPDTALGGDNRTGCAVVLSVARTLLARQGDHAPTTLVFFVQEEVGLVGARGLDVKKLGDPRPEVGFNFDGHHAEEFITAVTGTERFTIDVAGIAAHSGMNPQAGVSAALIAADALAELARTGWHGVITRADGLGFANVGTIHGGTGSNVVMPELHMLAEARSHDPTFRRAILAAWRDAFRRAALGRRNVGQQTGEVRFGPGPTYEAYALDANAPVVQLALAAAARIGLSARCLSDNGGNDANWIVAHGIPTVTIGCGQRNVHTPSEFVDLGDFHRACSLATELV